MAYFYNVGETKKRPGTYFRYENRGSGSNIGTTENAVAIPIQADWGPTDAVTVHESPASITDTYGNKGTVDAALALFEGGAPKVYVVRLDLAKNNAGGTAGAKGTLALGDVAIIEAKYPGTKEIKVQVRVKVDGVSKEIVVYNGNSEVEAFSFNVGGDEAASLVAAVAGSAYITAKKSAQTTESTVEVKDATALSGGADPSINTESYSEALTKLEPYQFTHLVLDCVKDAEQALVKTWLNRVFKEGKFCVAVLGGENKGKSLADLTAKSIAFDDEKIVYSGIWGKNSAGEVVDGYKMAALVAGHIANTPSNQSIVRSTVPGIASIEPFTNAEYEQAIDSGLLLASYSAAGTVWFDSGINTLINLKSDQDAGWKKIRRVATRLEMMIRLDNAIAPLSGRINCDSDGIAQVVARGLEVLNAMVSEGKLKEGAEFYEDPERPHEADSAWFVSAVDDYDSLEKIYTKHGFRFSSNS